jgi:hypothetical protein
MNDTEEIDRSLMEAEDKLNRVEKGVTETAFIRRLDREAPLHPLLLVWRGCIALAGIIGILIVIILIAPEISTGAAVAIAQFDVVPGVPLPMILALVGVVLMLFGFGMRQLAIMRAERSPMLTGELKQHQRLVNDVNRAQANADLHQRLKDKKPHD